MTADVQNLLEISKTIIWVFEKFPADNAAINMLVEQLPKLKKAVAAFESDAEFKGILHDPFKEAMDSVITEHDELFRRLAGFGGTATIHG